MAGATIVRSIIVTKIGKRFLSIYASEPFANFGSERGVSWKVGTGRMDWNFRGKMFQAELRLPSRDHEESVLGEPCINDPYFKEANMQSR